MKPARTRCSRQRDVVLAIVRSTMDHPTADWVYRQARRRLPRISLGNHIRCRGCGRVSDLPLSVSRRLEEDAGRATSYHIVSHEVFVQGLCPGCQEAAQPVRNRSH